MEYQFTPAVGRALVAAAGWARGADCDELEAPSLLLGLLDESECRAALTLADHGIDAAAVRRHWPDLTPCEGRAGDEPAPARRFSADIKLSLQVATERLAEYPRSLELATEHLLLGLVAAEHEVSAWLRAEGLNPEALEAEIDRLYGHRPGPLPFEPVGGVSDGDLADVGGASDGVRMPVAERSDVTASSSKSVPTGASLCSAPATPSRHEQVRTLRVLDAAANRAREGLRVVEDYVRFVLDDRHLTDRCKQLRHDLAAVLGRISIEHRLAARETQADVGTELATPAEQYRENAAAVLGANFTRLQEGLRSLEEFGKLPNPNKPWEASPTATSTASSATTSAAELRQLRYRSYTLQRAVEITRTSLERLSGARLYVLADGRSSPEEFQRLVRSLIEAGAHMIQLRDKELDDRRLLERARLLSELTRDSNTLFVMNDRADLAALARADGIHVGQEELSVKDARTIVGPDALVGVSTHSIEQARQAVLDGANYLGVGPTFPSDTKQFEQFPGVELLRAVVAEIRLPAFAIGGISRENLSEVLSAGFTRVALSSTITTADDPAAAAQEMLAMLERDE